MASDKKISNIKRLRQIVNAFVKHGLGDMVKLSGLDTYISIVRRVSLKKASEEKVRFTRPQRMVMVFEELGPTFIKLGQILSTRKDQLPKEYVVEFEKLRDKAKPLPFEDMDTVFKAEFGKSTLETFDYIDKTPIASASIGQVHVARLKTGEEVVVKIRKPGIEHVINADIKILYFVANRIKKMLLKENELLNPPEIVKAFEVMIKNELDFCMEGRNIERFQHNFKDKTNVHFPNVYWEYSSMRVLVMEEIKGIPVGEVVRLRENGHNLNKVAHTIFHLTLKQMFIDSFFHADPHPGNFIIMENDVVGIIDCGMVGFMEEDFVNSFMDCFVGIFLKDYDLVVRGYMLIGTITEDIDVTAFKNDIRNFAEHYMSMSLTNSSSIGAILDDGIAVGVRNKMKIPAAMLFTSKALILVEGTVRKIDPSFDFIGHSTKFAQKLIAKKKFEPKKLIADTLSFISGMSDLFQTLPRQTAKILSIMEDQKMGMNLNIPAMEEFNKNFSAFAACIALGVISAGLAVGGSLVIHARIPPLWHGISMFGLFGYLMAVVVGLWVVYLFARKDKKD